MKKKRTGLKVVFIVLGAFALIIAGFAWFLMFGQGVKNAVIKPVDVSKLQDGSYQGVYSGGRFGNKVEIVISGGKISDIKVLKDMTVSIPSLSQKIFAEVEQNQTLAVDTVSGATVSSKAYLMALENALAGK